MSIHHRRRKEKPEKRNVIFEIPIDCFSVFILISMIIIYYHLSLFNIFYNYIVLILSTSGRSDSVTVRRQFECLTMV